LTILVKKSQEKSRNCPWPKLSRNCPWPKLSRNCQERSRNC